MKNSIELQFRALRPPRVLKKNEAGDPQLIDVWAIHHADRTARQFAIAVKFGRRIVTEANEIKTGTLFTVKGQLDQRRNPTTGIYHTFIWADEVVELVHSKKAQAEAAASSAQPLQDETPELDLVETGEEHETLNPKFPMPKVHDPIPSRSFSIAVVGDDLETLTEIVNEARRLKPEWHDTPQTILVSIVEDFLGQADAFDQFVLTRVDSEQRALLRQIAELKGLKRAVRTGTLEGDTGNDTEEAAGQPATHLKRAEASPTPPPLGSASPAVR